MSVKGISLIRAGIPPERGVALHVETGKSDVAYVGFRKGKVAEIHTPDEPLKRVHELLHARHTDSKADWPDVSEDVRQVIEDIKLHRLHWPWKGDDTPGIIKASISAVLADEVKMMQKARLDAVMIGKPEAATFRAARLSTVARAMSFTGIVGTIPGSKLIGRGERRVLSKVVSLCSNPDTWKEGARLLDEFISLSDTPKSEIDPVDTIIADGRATKPGKGEAPKHEVRKTRGEKMIDMEIIDLPKPYASKLQTVTETDFSSSGRTLNSRELLRGKRFMRPTRLFQRETDENQRGGSVLIDASGSMQITTEVLKAFCENLPAATIAYYGGNDDEYAPAGELIIYAKDGRRADDLQPVQSGNSVDLPALRWLLKQEGPRYFITDSGFCGGGGTNDFTALALFEKSKALGEVIGLHDVETAQKFFAPK